MKLLIDAKANINAESVRAAHVPPGRAAASARLAPLSPLARWVEALMRARQAAAVVWRALLVAGVAAACAAPIGSRRLVHALSGAALGRAGGRREPRRRPCTLRRTETTWTR